MQVRNHRLELNEEEAFALLSLAMTSGLALDETSENAVRKLAEYCKAQSAPISNHVSIENRELCGAG